MLETTEAIVLNSFAYNETSLITKLYTEKFGLKGYIIKGVRKRKSSFSSSLFQPLQLIEAEVYNNSKQSLQILKSATLTDDVSALRFDMIKSTLAIFITEIISNSIREEMADISIFKFLSCQIKSLNAANRMQLSKFHINFMTMFATYLGFSLEHYDCNNTLNSLVLFYETHITSGRRIVSHNILHEILH
ncbi:MAG: DNA repair protein RecO [Bacteroidales bacterium]|jgi:DNA repair protein RecO (recombination protein O)|nr:DNA repair protein RecO [Bacteroidales bacterium]